MWLRVSYPQWKSASATFPGKPFRGAQDKVWTPWRTETGLSHLALPIPPGPLCTLYFLLYPNQLAHNFTIITGTWLTGPSPWNACLTLVILVTLAPLSRYRPSRLQGLSWPSRQVKGSTAPHRLSAPVTPQHEWDSLSQHGNGLSPKTTSPSPHSPSCSTQWRAWLGKITGFESMYAGALLGLFVYVFSFA